MNSSGPTYLGVNKRFRYKISESVTSPTFVGFSECSVSILPCDCHTMIYNLTWRLPRQPTTTALSLYPAIPMHRILHSSLLFLLFSFLPPIFLRRCNYAVGRVHSHSAREEKGLEHTALPATNDITVLPTCSVFLPVRYTVMLHTLELSNRPTSGDLAATR